MRIRLLVAILCIAPAFAFVSEAAAWSPKLEVNEDTWMQFGILGQFRFEAGENLAGTTGEQWSTEFYTRRARIMGLGSVHPNVRFFFSTDVPNTGRAGLDNTIVWNDGFVDFQFSDEIKIAFGRILVPFSVENQASAATLLGIDYNLSLLKIPTPVDRAFWRDDGIEARGLLINGLIDYRLAVLRGIRDGARNPNFTPRVTGMVLINIQDSQGGWFYNPNSLGSLNVLSFGGGVDYMPHSAEGIDDALAWSAFALVDQPAGPGRINAMAGYYNWDGPGWAGGFEGATMGLQLGYLLPGNTLQPVARLQRQEPEGAKPLNTINVGLNYFIKGHAANIKLDYAINDRRDGAGERRDAFRLQAQLLF